MSFLGEGPVNYTAPVWPQLYGDDELYFVEGTPLRPLLALFLIQILSFCFTFRYLDIYNIMDGNVCRRDPRRRRRLDRHFLSAKQVGAMCRPFLPSFRFCGRLCLGFLRGYALPPSRFATMFI